MIFKLIPNTPHRDPDACRLCWTKILALKPEEWSLKVHHFVGITEEEAAILWLRGWRITDRDTWLWTGALDA